jgi:predicted negative regulator of RcsB-dependent stress response
LTELLTEQEQIEQLKKWIRLYGIPSIFGIIAGIAIFYGWNAYQAHQTKVLTQASSLYDEMLTDRSQANVAATDTQAGKILEDYAATPYGEVARLMLARDAVSKQDYREGLKQLTQVMDHASNASIREIARLRIARIYLAQQKPQDALTLLQSTDDKAFAGLAEEVTGDAYQALNNPAEARKAYTRAIQKLPNAEDLRPILTMKLDNLATAD